MIDKKILKPIMKDVELIQIMLKNKYNKDKDMDVDSKDFLLEAIQIYLIYIESKQQEHIHKDSINKYPTEKDLKGSYVYKDKQYHYTVDLAKDVYPIIKTGDNTSNDNKQ